MDVKDAALFNSFLNAVGTTIAAIGATPINILTESAKQDLSLIGNAFQAAGSALQANIALDASEYYGNGLQAIGNSIEIYGLTGNSNDDTHQRAQITGDWFQALGGSYALKQNLDSEGDNLEQSLIIISDFMQVIGNSLQAVSGTFQLNKVTNEENADRINATGSWIQALGAFLAFLLTMHDYCPSACVCHHPLPFLYEIKGSPEWRSKIYLGPWPTFDFER